MISVVQYVTRWNDLPSLEKSREYIYIVLSHLTTHKKNFRLGRNPMVSSVQRFVVEDVKMQERKNKKHKNK